MLFLLICAAIFIDSFFYGIIIPVLPAYAKTNLISAQTLCMIFALYPLSMLIFSIPFGLLANKISPGIFLVSGLVVLICSACIFAYARTVDLFFAGRFLQGMGATAIWAAGLAWLGKLYPHECRGQKIGLTVLTSGIGVCSGMVLGGFLSEWFGKSLPFYVCAILALFLMPVFVFLNKSGNSAPKSGKPVRIPWTDPKLLFACLAIILGVAGLGMFEPLLPIFVMERFGANKITVGVLFGVIYLAYIVTQPVLGSFSDRYGRKPFILAGCLIVAGLTPLVVLSGALKILFLIGPFLGIGIGLLITPSTALISEVFSKNGAPDGVWSGFFNMSMSLGLALGPLLSGFVYERIGFSGVCFAYAIVIFLSGILAAKIRFAEHS